MNAMKNMSTAVGAWGESMPEWVRVLAEQCDLSNQRKVSKAIRLSNGLVSAVLAKTYPGNLDNVRQAVEGAYMAARVDCPLLGNIGGHECRKNRSRPLQLHSSAAAQLWRACRHCKHNPNH